MRLIWLGTHCSDCYLQESGYGRRVPLWNLFGCRGHWMYNQCPAPYNCVTECRQLTSNALFARPAFRKAEDDARNISQVSKARLDAALGILTWWWQGGWTGCRRSLKVPSNPGDSSVLRFSYTQHRSKNLVSSCLQFVFIVKVYFRIFTIQNVGKFFSTSSLAAQTLVCLSVSICFCMFKILATGAKATAECCSGPPHATLEREGYSEAPHMAGGWQWTKQFWEGITDPAVGWYTLVPLWYEKTFQ